MLIYIIIFIAAAVVATTLVVGRTNRNTRYARILRIVAQALTVATWAFNFIPAAIASNTSATFRFMLGVPLAAAVLPSLGGSNILLWVAAVIITGWAIVHGLGNGLYMLPAGLCMLAAAAVQPWASAKEGHM